MKKHKKQKITKKEKREIKKIYKRIFKQSKIIHKKSVDVFKKAFTKDQEVSQRALDNLVSNVNNKEISIYNPQESYWNDFSDSSRYYIQSSRNFGKTNFMDNWSEDRLQQECFQWAWNEYKEARRCFFHVANERHFHNIVEASRYKSIGVIPGVHDMPFFWKGKLYLFEFKVGKGDYSSNQEIFKEVMEAQGATCILCRSLEFFKFCFKNIMDGVDLFIQK